MSAPPTEGRALVAEWYHQHFAHLVRLGALASGDRAAAEDAVQEVFAAVHRRPPELADPSNPLPYLRVAVLNRCRSLARRRGSHDRATLRLIATADVTVDDVEHRGLSPSTDRAVMDAVRSLPARQRDVMLLRYWLDLSETEIAETLGVAPGTVKSAASRARTTLAPILEALR